MKTENKPVITRREHMDTIPRDAETPEALDAARAAHHRAYYSQFVTPAIKARVLLYIKLPELLASECEHFNDIALSRGGYDGKMRRLFDTWRRRLHRKRSRAANRRRRKG